MRASTAGLLEQFLACVRDQAPGIDDRLPRRFTEESAPLYEYELDPDTGEMHRSDEPLRYGKLENFDGTSDESNRMLAS